MTKKDIVKTIAADADLTQLKVKEIVQRTFDEIIETLVRDGKIELRNFGVSKVTKRAARPARNPRTSAPVNVPEKCVVTFKPGKEMAGRIRSLKDVPGKEIQSESDATDSQDSPVVSLHQPLPGSSPAEVSAPATSPVAPNISPSSEIGTNESETSFNQLAGE